MSPDTRSLLDRLDQVASFLQDLPIRSAAVSRWSIGQQAEHVIRATSAFTVLILRNRPSDGSGDIRPIKNRFFALGMIPRGVAEAPDGTLPAEETTPDELQQLLLKTRKRIERLVDVDPASVAIHPYLGEMNRDEIIRFMVIHLDHHLTIMQEILDSHAGRS